MIAVIKTGGKQYAVKEGDVLKVEKLIGEKDSSIKLSEVLMVAEEDGTANIGKPLLANASVSAKIVEQGRGEKITIIKFKSKSRYRRKRGHHQLFTKLQIEKISC